MTLNLRQLAESDLSFTLEGDFKMLATITAPSGISDTLYGQVLYDTLSVNPDTGEPMVVNNPVVTLRRSSLSASLFAAIPQAGEKWFIRIPSAPTAGAALADYVLNADRPPEGGASIGFIRLYLQKAEQS